MIASCVCCAFSEAAAARAVGVRVRFFVAELGVEEDEEDDDEDEEDEEEVGGESDLVRC